MTSPFDPNIFLSQEQTEVNEKRPPIPADNLDSPDGLYVAVIGEISAGKSGVSEKSGLPWAQMIVPLKLQLGPQTQASTGITNGEFTLTDRPFLDLTAQGSLDNSKGKNRSQRIYRDATGLNKPGEVFAWRMLTGKVVKVKVVHEDYQGSIQEKIANILPS